ncbi:MAG: Gfo/Idh/MocA family protein [Sphingomonadaceae bacterium]
MTGQNRVAVIGVGYWGQNIARSFAGLGALGAVVDANAANADRVAAATGAPTRTLDDVLTDAGIAGVAIATRAETHFAIASRALAAGKHVLVEKPLVLDLGEADRLIAQAQSVDRILMVGHLLRYHPHFRRMLEIVRSGQYGVLRHVYSDRLSLGKIRTEEDVLWSFAPHDISMILALAGAEPINVTAQGSAFINPPIHDYSTAQLSFASGLKADIRASWLSYKKVQQCVAICDAATIVFEDSEKDWDRKLAIHPHTVVREDGLPVAKRGDMAFVVVDQSEPLVEECAHFLDCIAQGKSAMTDGTEGRAVLRVLQRATAAMQTLQAAP